MDRVNRIKTIANDEILYRRVDVNTSNMHPNGRRYIYHSEDWIEVKSPAFSGEKPSVDIARLTGFDPTITQQCDVNGVISLIVGDVLGIKIDNHIVKVVHSPENTNYAHSEIVIIPMLENLSRNQQEKALKDLRHKLAFIANQTGWLLKPKNVEVSNS